MTGAASGVAFVLSCGDNLSIKADAASLRRARDARRTASAEGSGSVDLDTFCVRRGASAPSAEHARIDETLTILNLRQCLAQRCDFITRSGDEPDAVVVRSRTLAAPRLLQRSRSRWM
jgi:hypothetical protein